MGVEDPRPQRESCSAARPPEADETVTHRLPPDFDPEVFRLLPAEIQDELLSPAYTNSLPSSSGSSSVHQTKDGSGSSLSVDGPADSDSPGGLKAFPGGSIRVEKSSQPESSDCDFPGNVDPTVFSELPPDVQRELMSEWKQQKPALKTSSSRKPGRSCTARDRKAAARGSQTNSLFKYFKPS